MRVEKAFIDYIDRCYGPGSLDMYGFLEIKQCFYTAALWMMKEFKEMGEATHSQEKLVAQLDELESQLVEFLKTREK